MSRCFNCGCELEEGQVKCPACGYAVTERPAQQVRDPAEEVSAESISKYMDFMSNSGLYRAGICKLEGIGMKQDTAEALAIFHKLAERGHHDGMYKLAELYLKLNPPDRKSALFWLNTAAAQGHIASRLKLAEMNADQAVITPPKFESAAPAVKGAQVQPAYSGSFVEKVRVTLPHILTIRSSYTEGNYRKYSNGAGFILDGGFVITNAHVIGEKSQQVTAAFEPSIDNRTYEMQTLCVEPDYDIAVLRFKGAAEEKFGGQKHLELKLNPVLIGEDVYTIGNPLGLGLSVTHGIVSNPARATEYPRLVEYAIQTDMTVNHGNSGGALFASDNRVAGIISFTPSECEGGMAMCVPAEYIVKVLNEKI